MSEGVNKACVQQVSESVSFLLSEAGILLVGFGVLQVNFVVCNIHVTTDYDGFLSIQFLNVTPMDGSRLQVFDQRKIILCQPEHEVPAQPLVQVDQLFPSIGHIGCH